jgi:hypothetical protein
VHKTAWLVQNRPAGVVARRVQSENNDPTLEPNRRHAGSRERHPERELIGVALDGDDPVIPDAMP